MCVCVQELRELKEMAGILNQQAKVSRGGRGLHPGAMSDDNHFVCLSQSQSQLTEQVEEDVSRADESSTGARYALFQVGIGLPVT